MSVDADALMYTHRQKVHSSCLYQCYKIKVIPVLLESSFLECVNQTIKKGANQMKCLQIMKSKKGLNHKFESRLKQGRKNPGASG